jgi:hypothetical protein
LIVDRARLLDLFGDYFDQCLDETGLAALNASLANSPEACRLFWEYAEQQALLVDLLAEQQGRYLAQQEQELARCTLSRAREKPSQGRRVLLGGLAAAAAILSSLARPGLCIGVVIPRQSRSPWLAWVSCKVRFTSW